MAKKKTSKKKAPAKKKTASKKAPARKKKVAGKKRGGAQQLDYQISGAATKAMSKRGGLFFDLPPESHTHTRVVPRFDGNASIFAKSVLHYGFKDDEGGKVAMGCLDHHGTKETGDWCYTCALAEWLVMQEDPNLRKLGEGFGSLEQVEILYMQAWIFTPSTKEWTGPKLIKAKGKISTKLGDLISSAEDFGSVPFAAPVGGQVVVLDKTGAGLQTRYDVQTTGNFIDMDDVDEEWQSKAIKNIPVKLAVKVLPPNELKKMLHRTYPDLPWDLIQKAIG